MIRKIFTFFLMLNFFVINAQDLIERTQLGIAPIENADLQATNNLTIILQEKKQLSSSRTAKDYPLFKVANQRQSSSRRITKAIPLNLEQEVLTEIRTQASSLLNLSIPVSESAAFELDLYRINIHSEGFKVSTSTPVDQVVQHTGIFYNGIIKGNPNSSVAVSIFEDQVVIYIQDRRGTYKVTKEEASNNYLLYNGKDRVNKHPLKCNVDNNSYKRTAIQRPTVSSSRNSILPVVGIYIEVDHALFIAQNSNLNAVNTYIEAMMTQAIAIYGTLGIPIKMSALKIHTTLDGYANNSGDTSPKLVAFANTIKDNYVGRLAHLITGEIGGGEAYLDVLCATYATDGQSASYAITGISETDVTVPAIDDINTFVHELGHNFGSLHTQACYWNGNNTPLDGCVNPESYDENTAACAIPDPDCPRGFGTIMSYCEEGGTCPLTNEWHPQVATHIKGRYQEMMSCLTDFNCQPTQIVTTPFINGNTSASISVETQGTVKVNGETIFSAPTVTLKAGFCVPQGQDFLATTIGCTAFMSDGTCNAPHSIKCGTPFQGNTATGTNNWITYENETGYTGNEVLHTVTVPAYAHIEVTLSGLTADLDMFFLLDCMNGTPVHSDLEDGTTSEVIKLTNLTDSPRTYYIIVDGYMGATSTYQLNCREVGLCEAPIELICGEVFQGTSFNGEFIWYEYGNITAEGPEIIHFFQQMANTSTTIALNALSPNVNLDLIVLQDCDTDFETVINSGTTSGNESITITNSTNAAVERYIIVDGVDDNERGAYSLTLTCNANFTNTEDSSLLNSQLRAASTTFSTTQLSIQPNPANKNIAIQYQLAQESVVSIDLYNANGQQLRTLLPKGIQAAGGYQFKFNAMDLPEGIYYTTLSTNETSITEKLVLIR